MQLSFDDPRLRSGRGGPREGAGRPRARRSVVYHVRRDRLHRDNPVHVTLRLREGIPSLRRSAFVREIRRSFRAGCERSDSGLIHFSIQRDHLHLLLESNDERALANAMKCISSRVARAVNRVFHRTGRALRGRYHVRALGTPREVRNALAYVLLNARKHWKQRHGVAPPVRIDEASSGAWFGGWSRLRPDPPGEPSPVASPRTWLLRSGWVRHGLIDPAELPGSSIR